MSQSLNFGAVLVPEGWVVNASVNVVGPALQMPPAANGQPAQPMYPSLNVMMAGFAGEEVTLDELCSDQLARLEFQLPKFKLVEQCKLPGQDGRELACLIYTFAPMPNVEMQQIQAVYLEKGVVTYLTGTVPASHFKDHVDTLKSMLQSYRHA